MKLENLKYLVTGDVKLSEALPIHNVIKKHNSKKKSLSQVLSVLHELKHLGVSHVLWVDPDEKRIKLRVKDLLHLSKAVGVAPHEKNGLLRLFHRNCELISHNNPKLVKEALREVNARSFGEFHVKDLEDLVSVVNELRLKKLHAYFYKGEFSSWLRSINESCLAKEFDELMETRLKGIALRNALTLLLLKKIKKQVVNTLTLMKEELKNLELE